MEVKNCLVCDKEFKVYGKPPRMRAGKFCSMKCRGAGQTLGLTSHKPGTVHELTCEQCKNPFQVKNRVSLTKPGCRKAFRYCSTRCLHDARKAGRAPRPPVRNEKTKLKRSLARCEICGFRRAVAMARIVAGSQGGRYEKGNVLGLCPNHHHLFDTGALYKHEVAKLPSHAQEAYAKGRNRKKHPWTRKAADPA